MKIKKEDLEVQFFRELGKVRAPEVFLGVARILHVSLLDGEEPRDFAEILEDMLVAFGKEKNKRRKELLNILKDANCEEKI